MEPDKLKTIGSPLRYPGGKSKALKYLLPLIPDNFSCYLEPFLGGGSMLIAIAQKFPDIQCAAAEMDVNTVNFWSQLKCPEKAERLRQHLSMYLADSAEWEILRDARLFKEKEYQTAFEFYVLNRNSFSGTMTKGGVKSKVDRFNQQGIAKLTQYAKILQNTSIHRTDWSFLLAPSNQKFFRDPFIYLDPPYYINGKKIYKHWEMDWEDFRDALKIETPWMVTVKDHPYMRELFDNPDWNIVPLEFAYGMNNCGKEKIQKPSNEIIIRNYRTRAENEIYQTQGGKIQATAEGVTAQEFA